MNDNQNTNVYVENGFKDRLDYLASLADEYGVPFYTVHMLANLLGTDEDFDGLVTSLQDMEE